MDQFTNKILARIRQIPSFPENIQSLVQAIDREDTSASDIAAMVENDPAISTNILRLANSAFYGFLGKVSSIRDAVVLIGLREVKNLVLGTTVLKFFPGASQSGFQRNDLWRHSVVCAFLTKMLAKEAFLPDPEGSAMVSGLIHDIGKVVLDQYFPEMFTRVVRKVRDNGVTFSQAEKEVLGYSHNQIGAALLKMWNFPPELVTAVLYHHHPWRDPLQSPVSATVYYANILAKVLHYPSFNKEPEFTMDLLNNNDHKLFLEKNGFPTSPEAISIFLAIAEARLAMENSGLFTIFSLAA